MVCDGFLKDLGNRSRLSTLACRKSLVTFQATLLVFLAAAAWARIIAIRGAHIFQYWQAMIYAAFAGHYTASAVHPSMPDCPPKTPHTKILIAR